MAASGFGFGAPTERRAQSSSAPADRPAALTLRRAADCRATLSLSYRTPVLATLVVDSRGSGFSLTVRGPQGDPRRSVPRSLLDGPTTVSFFTDPPGAYRVSLAALFCEHDVDVAIRPRLRRVPPDVAASWVELETRFEQAEELRLRFDEPTSRRAHSLFQEVASAALEAGALALAARASHRQASILDALGNLEEAADVLSEAVRFAETDGDPELQGAMLASLGLAETVVGRTDDAEARCRAALAHGGSLPSERVQAEARLCLAEVSYHRGDLRGAVSAQREVLDVAVSAGRPWLEARTRLLMAYSQSDLSELEPAGANFLRALELFERLGERRLQAITLVALGRLSLRLGENQDAIDRFQDAVELLEPMGDKVWKASALAGFGEVSFNLGLQEGAAVHYEASLDLLRSAGLRVAVVEALLALGEVLLASGRTGPALSRFTEALDLSRELDIARWESLSLVLIGRVHHRNGSLVEALRYFRLALTVMPDDALRYRALTWNAIGVAHRDLGQSAPSVDAFRRALELSRTSLDRLQEASSRYYLADAAASAGDLVAARRELDGAIEIAESLRGRVLSRELRSSFLATVRDYYELYVDVLMRASTPSSPLVNEAFRVVELARARALLDQLAESRVDVRSGVEEVLLARERRVRELYSAKALFAMELLERGADAAELRAVDDEMALLAADHDRIQSRIRSSSPNFAALTQPSPATLPEVQSELLDDESVLFEYSLGSERSYLWVVTRDGAESFTLPPRREIEERARELYELVTTRQRRLDESPGEWRRRVRRADDDAAHRAVELSRILLAPARTALHGRRRVVVAAEGALLYVPFGALPVDGAAPGQGAPLVAEYEIVRVPSASVLAALRRGRSARRRTAPRVAIFADPVLDAGDPRLDLPSFRGSESRQTEQSEQSASDPGSRLPVSMPRLAATRLEARAIEELAPRGAVLTALGFEATRERVLGDELRHYDIVHFATHGLLNDDRPELSGVVLSLVDERGLSRDGFLRLHDIYNLNLPARLVVLSACDTALGKPLRGEGLVGLVRGFLHAGARSVVASLWKVEDEATTELMTRFYRLMLRESMNPSAALRAAQNSLRQDGRFGPPFYWAAFELHGDWVE